MKGARSSRGTHPSYGALAPTASQGPEPFVLSKALRLDFSRRITIVRGRTVRLTPKEFDLLKHLVINHGRPVSHRRLLQAVWGPEYGEETELLRVLINQLRRKMEAQPNRPDIQTEPYLGYRFTLPADALCPNSDERPRRGAS